MTEPNARQVLALLADWRAACERREGLTGEARMMAGSEAIACGDLLHAIPSDHLRTLSLTLPEPEQADKAVLWDALMGSARLRILGYAGPHDTGYAHFGLEAWTMYPGHDFNENNASARQIITDYCRAALTLVTDATEGES